MSLGVCEVGCVWQNTYAWVREKLKGGLYRNILKIHFGTIVESDLQTPRRPPPFEFVPQFFFGTNLPKMGRVLTLTETGPNPNRNGS